MAICTGAGAIGGTTRVVVCISGRSVPRADYFPRRLLEVKPSVFRRAVRIAWCKPIDTILCCTHRACDYVRLIGVLARENSSFIAAYVREQHGVVEDERWDKSSYNK